MAHQPLPDTDDAGVFHTEQGLTPANLRTGGTLGWMILGFSLLAVLLGLVWLGIGGAIAAGYTPVWEQPVGRRHGVVWMDAIAYLLFGSIFTAGGLFSLLWRSEVTIDPGTRTWKMRRGLLPLAPWRTGTYAALGGLMLMPETRAGRTYHFLYLKFKTAGSLVRLRHAGFQARIAERMAREYADHLHLPLLISTTEDFSASRRPIRGRR